MPWAKQTIIINGESVEAMAKVSEMALGLLNYHMIMKTNIN